MFKITEITKEEANKIIETKEPLGLFWYRDDEDEVNRGYVAINNSSGEAFNERFVYRSDSYLWLKDCLYAYKHRLTMGASMSSYHAEVKRVSELMTTMILSGASTEEMERVIDYSKNVLDTFKWELRCKQSKKDNNIDELVKRYGDEV